MANYLDTLEQFGGNGENDDEIKNVDKIIKEVTDEEKLKSLIRIANAQISHIRGIWFCCLDLFKSSIVVD